jgi:hypothetical protein
LITYGSLFDQRDQAEVSLREPNFPRYPALCPLSSDEPTSPVVDLSTEDASVAMSAFSAPRHTLEFVRLAATPDGSP